jgi:anhydro-N-acetylmuramic acid kinase
MLRILGTMTGTSCDGLDLSCLSFNNKKWAILWEKSLPYSKSLRNRVIELQTPGSNTTLKTLKTLDRDLGDFYGASIIKHLKRVPNSMRPHVIGNHGQTVFHCPEKFRKGTTLQLGDPSRIAFHTGLTIVSNFRDGDMAAGGEGAPLVPLYHKSMAEFLRSTPKSPISIHNIGGISNFTYLGNKGEILAFDTGPGNIWIDASVQDLTKGLKAFDKSGKIALSGHVNAPVLEKLMKHPYLKLRPPKSTGRDDFTYELFRKHFNFINPDAIRTATEYTAETIAYSYRNWVPLRKDEKLPVFFCGGGVKNHFLISEISRRLPMIEIKNLSDYGFNSQFIESQAFSYFSHLALQGKSLGGPWTGAQNDAPTAHLSPGKNWSTLLKLLK